MPVLDSLSVKAKRAFARFMRRATARESTRAGRAAAGLIAPDGTGPDCDDAYLLLAFESPSFHENFAREFFPLSLQEFDGPDHRFHRGEYGYEGLVALSVPVQFAPGHLHTDLEAQIGPSALAEFGRRHDMYQALSIQVRSGPAATAVLLDFAYFCYAYNAIPSYSVGANVPLAHAAAGLIAHCRVSYVLLALEPPTFLEQFAREIFPRNLQEFPGLDTPFRSGTHAYDETLVAVSVTAQFAPEYQREYPDARVEPPALAEFGQRHHVYRALSIQVGSSLQATRLVFELGRFCRDHNTVLIRGGGTCLLDVTVPHDLPVVFTLLVYGATRALAVHGATWFYAPLLARCVAREDSGRDVDLGLLRLVYGNNHNGRLWLYHPAAERALRQAFHDIGVDPAPTTIRHSP